MSTPTGTNPLGRRGFLIGAGALGATALAACTSNSKDKAAASTATSAPAAAGGGGANDAAGKAITVGFSAPAADHGWIGAITKNAKAEAGKYSDVTMRSTEGTNDVNQQIAQVETLINAKVDVIVILPYDGKALTPAGLKAMQAGIPVVNLDRVFDTPAASRTWIGGDNYGMGFAAGNWIVAQMKAKGVSNPVIAEIPGIDSLPLTQQRSKGFKDALTAAGFKIANRVPADFTPQGGEKAASNLLQAAPKLDAVWNHDDDQGIGVLAAMSNAGRKEFIMVGGAGSKNAMLAIQKDDSPLKATVTYSPSMASSAIKLARLVAHGQGMSDLVEKEVPSSITLASATVTKDNVAQYLQFGFDS